MIKLAQIPVTDSTYSRLHVLKANAVIEKESSVTWDDVISAACDLCTDNKQLFINAIMKKVGKSRTVEVKLMDEKKELKTPDDVKEDLAKGNRVTSKVLEQICKKNTKRFKE